MKRFFMCVGLILISPYSFSEYEHVSLGQLLTQEEMMLLKVDKLSSSEKENLKIVLINKINTFYENGYQTGKLENMQMNSRIQAAVDQINSFKPNEEKIDDGNTVVLESRIDGEFDGFEADKVFRLFNGQVWQQTDLSLALGLGINPRVTIFTDNYGKYKMKVEGMERAVSVTRVR